MIDGRNFYYQNRGIQYFPDGSKGNDEFAQGVKSNIEYFKSKYKMKFNYKLWN